MTEESRGKRRKQANPRRNRGKTCEGLESLKKLMRVEDVAAAFPANRAGCVFTHTPEFSLTYPPAAELLLLIFDSSR